MSENKHCWTELCTESDPKLLTRTVYLWCENCGATAIIDDEDACKGEEPSKHTIEYPECHKDLWPNCVKNA